MDQYRAQLKRVQELQVASSQEQALEMELQGARKEGEKASQEMQRAVNELRDARDKYQRPHLASTNEEELQASRNREHDLRREVQAAKDDAEKSREQMQNTLSDLESARVTIQRYESLLNDVKTERTQLIEQLNEANAKGKTLEARNQVLTQERGEAKAAVKRLRGAVSNDTKSPHDAYSLDPFNNTLDQVSEAHVKCSGQPSVEGINDAIDTLTCNVLEQTVIIAAAQGDSVPRRPVELGSSYSKDPLVSAFAIPYLTEDNRGLLLDAFLHTIILLPLHRLFFDRDVSTVRTTDADFLNEIFEHISKKGMSVLSTMSVH
jgi:hypothetical protein